MLARGYLVNIIQKSVGKNNNADTLLKAHRQLRKCILRTCSVAVNPSEDDSEDKKDNLIEKLKKFKVQNVDDNNRSIRDNNDQLSNDFDFEENRHLDHRLGRHNRFFNSENRNHSHNKFGRYNGPESRFRNKFSKPGRFANRYEESELWDDEGDPRDRESQYGFRNTYGRKHERTPGFQQENRFSSRYSYSGSSFRNTDYMFERPEREMPVYEPFKKDFYSEKESVQNRTEEEVLEFLDEHNITSHGKEVLRPVTAFEEAGFTDVLHRRLVKESWDVPTPIQSVTWPQALAGKDVVGIAQTGSGKTLGFMMPAFEHILNQEPLRRGDGPMCLVLVPTRELCQQVQSVARDFGRVSGIRSCAVYGGAGRHPQIAALQRGSEICVATPGRMNDLLSSGETNLDRCTYLVLDEADRMLDMGFEPQIRQIISQIRPDRQTLMWSATWPKEVRELARDYLSDYVQINVGSTELIANKNISQEIIVCEQWEKSERFNQILDEIMMSPDDEKVLIFTETKSMANELSRKIYRRGIHNVCIHGDKSQSERDRCLKAFSTSRVCVMVATDVCARGLDVSDITCVVNYDFPRKSTEDYIHRIGRTGRAGNKGKAITLFTSDNQSFAMDLIKVLQQTGQEIPQELKEMRYPFHGNRSKKPSRFGRYTSPRDRGSFRGRFQKREGYASGFTRMDDEF